MTPSKVVIPLLLLLCRITAAQSPSLPLPKFEVASVKGSSGEGQGVLSRFPGGRLVATRMLLADLICFAYSISPSQLVNLPSWAKDARFDIQAKSEEGIGAGQEAADAAVRLRLQSLLADRFGLVLSSDTREMAVFWLTVAKGGPKLERNQEKKFLIQRKGHTLTFQKAGIAHLVAQLNGQLQGETGRFVIDHTELAGQFDFSVTWRPVRSSTKSPETEAPILRDAVREQLGLQLTPGRGSVPVLAVTACSRPGEN